MTEQIMRLSKKIKQYQSFGVKQGRNCSLSKVGLCGFLVVMVLLTPGALIAQKNTNERQLNRYSQEKRLEYQVQRAAAEAYLDAQGLPYRQILADGREIEIQAVINDQPVYYITHNHGMAQTSRTTSLYPSGDLGLNLTGSSYNKLAKWDAGAVLTNHQEFDSRVTQGDSPSSTSDHATHVAGSLVASGVVSSAKGMAYQSDLLCYDWNSDESEMASNAADGLEVSNHSYGILAGWTSSGGVWSNSSIDSSISTVEDYKFGFYSNQSRDWDAIAYNAPYYLIVKSAGNDRGDGPADAGTNGKFELDGGSDGYDCMNDAAISKNVLTVGAVYEVSDYGIASDVVMSSFSSWGPTDDGRIKPDLVTKGVSVYSTHSTGTDQYFTRQGTSMATAGVTGTVVLLKQHYQATHNASKMRSATLKALLVHTADETGDHPGPDYQHGWGLMNGEAAASKITEDSQGQNVIDEVALSNDSTWSRQIYSDGLSDIKVTIAWTDSAGTPVAAALDPVDTMLVNDLNVKVTREGNTWYPWSLNRDDPSAAATRNTVNLADNIEQVEFTPPAAGQYLIEVDHRGTLSEDQYFGMIISGISEYDSIPACVTELSTITSGATDLPFHTKVAWQPSTRATAYDVYLGTNNPPTNILNGTTQGEAYLSYNLGSSTTYYLKVIARNSEGVATGCDTTWTFSTGSFTSTNLTLSQPLDENFDDMTTIGTGNDWSQDSNDEFDWSLRTGSTPTASTGPSSDHTSGTGKYIYVESSSPNYPSKTAIIYSPVVDLSQSPAPMLQYFYHLYGVKMGNMSVSAFYKGTWHPAVLSLAGDQGNTWQEAKHSLYEVAQSSDKVQFRIKAITGSSFTSDMAVDNLYLGSGSFYEIPASSTTSQNYQHSGATVSFTTPNTGAIVLQFNKFDTNPGINGSLPAGVSAISSEAYWEGTVLSGEVDGTYKLSLDLSQMSGISDYSTLKLVKRSGSSASWSVAGSNAYAGSGETVAFENISGGFSQFGIASEGDNSLPVSLSSFVVKPVRGGNELSWQTSSEIENLGFIVDRKQLDGDAEHWAEIGSYLNDPGLVGQGSTTRQTNYTLLDTTTQPHLVYIYRLADVSYEGVKHYHSAMVTTTISSNIPTEYKLLQNYPNPFNPVTTIQYGLPETSDLSLIIYDIKGQILRKHQIAAQPAGWSSWNWDGTDSKGETAATGIYLCQMRAGAYHQTIKMLIMR